VISARALLPWLGWPGGNARPEPRRSTPSLQTDAVKMHNHTVHVIQAPEILGDSTTTANPVKTLAGLSVPAGRALRVAAHWEGVQDDPGIAHSLVLSTPCGRSRSAAPGLPSPQSQLSKRSTIAPSYCTTAWARRQFHAHWGLPEPHRSKSTVEGLLPQCARGLGLGLWRPRGCSREVLCRREFTRANVDCRVGRLFEVEAIVHVVRVGKMGRLERRTIG
jgi:hypothetical protein